MRYRQRCAGTVQDARTFAAAYPSCNKLRRSMLPEIESLIAWTGSKQGPIQRDLAEIIQL
jgi:hypothetical protein